MDYATHIAGIPCIARVTYYRPGRAANTWGAPENCYDADPPDIDWVICDRRGGPAPWLQRKATAADKNRIYEELATLKD